MDNRQSFPIFNATAAALLLIGCDGFFGCHGSPAPSAPPAELRQDNTSSAPAPAAQPPAEEALAQTGSGHHGSTAATSKPGVFDFYLFTLSWSPEYCATHASSPECTRHLGFVVHGLWPQNNNGTYPENCSNAPGPANPQADTDLMPTVSLVEHEWTTHGTCSGLAADPYFNTVRKAFHEVAIPASLQNLHTQTMLPPATILGQFAKANPTFPAGSFALSCGSNYLTAMQVCLAKDLTPEACQHVQTCHANQVKILPQ